MDILYCTVYSLSAFKVNVESSEVEGDFVTYKAKVQDVFKKGKTRKTLDTAWKQSHMIGHLQLSGPSLTVSGPAPDSDVIKARICSSLPTGAEDIKINSEVELVKKATCSSTQLDAGQQYLVMGTEVMQIRQHRSFRWGKTF